MKPQEIPPTSPYKISSDACGRLAEKGVSASLEYPGWLCIQNKDGTFWAVSEEHGLWVMQLVTDRKYAGPEVKLGSPKTGAELAELILKNIDKRTQE